ncbi:hypothetical protein CEXT_394121 [Caerostris extrusa]|uniref:Uncharacterized protein n=1 Tax=Caerostris extrusa TaxID=172846 RepID=A0AAV4QG89_CAEEX|nr:hypothetical protein CEXT_394121 [Caerostris extrusa]
MGGPSTLQDIDGTGYAHFCSGDVSSEKLPLSDERNCSDSENSNFHVSIELGSRKLGSLSPQSSLAYVQISGKKKIPLRRKKLYQKEGSTNTRRKK